MRFEHRDRVARRAGRDAQPGQLPDRTQARPAGEQDALGLDQPGVGVHTGDARAAVGGRHRAQAGERRPLAQGDPGRLHRQAIGTDVPRRVDAPVGLDIAAAPVTGRGQRDGGIGGLGRIEPADVEPLGALHRDALATGALIGLGDREDQVAELAESGVGAVRRGLAAVEVDRPTAQGDGRGRAALGADDARRARRRAHPGQPALEDDHPSEPGRRREHRRPATDRPRAHDDQVRAIRHALVLRIGSPG